MSMQLHHTLMSQYKHGTASGIGSVSYESVANCVTPEVVIYGKSVQDSYTGKNLFDGNLLVGYFANATGEMTPATKFRSFYMDLPAGTYTISFVGTTVNIVRTLIDGVLTTIGANDRTYYTFTTSGGMTGLSWKRFDDAAWDDSTPIQIESGSTATSYESYVGGIASPNPLYPQDIVCNNNTYKCHGKNLLPFPYATNVGTYVRGGVTFTINEDGSITIKGTAGANANVTLLENANLGQANINARFTDSETNGEYAVSKYLHYNAETGVLIVSIGYGDYVDETIYPQVERGKIISAYDPYFDGGTVIAPELYSVDDVYQVGNIRDEYYPQTGKVIRRCKKVTLSSSDNLTDRSNDSRGICFDFRPDNVIAGHRTSLCSHFKNVSATWGNANKGNIGEYSDNDVNGWKFFRPPNDSIDTLDKFKAWLDEQVAIGKPVTLVYVLAEPIIEYVEPTPFYSKRSVNTAASFNPVLKAVGDVEDEYNPLTGEYIRRCQTREVKASWQYPPDGSTSLEMQGKSFCFDLPTGAMGYKTSICTHFDNVDNAWLAAYKDRYGIYSDHPTVTARYFRAPNESVTTVAEFTAWLLEQDKAGTPVLLTYVLAEPISGIVSGDVTIIEEDVNSAVTDTQIDVKYLTHS